MFTYALDEYGDFEGLKNTNKPIYIGGVIYDDHSIRREEVIERKRIKAYYKSVISEAASIANCTSNFSYPEALHSNGDADRNRNVVRPVKEIVKSTLAEFIRRGTYKGNKLQYEDRNGTLRDFQDRNGEYYIFIILKSDQGMTRLLSQNANILAKDDYASNLYFHMADELISRLIFNNPLIDDIQEISLDIATRRSALLENNSRLFKEYKKQGYKAEQAKMKQGEYLGSIPPYGFQIEKIDGKRTLVPEPVTSEIVREIFNRYASGETFVSLAKWLYGQKIHRPSDYKKYKMVYQQEGQQLRQWERESIRFLLTNDAYIGNLVQSGKHMKEQITAEHTHEPLVSEEVFYRVWERIEENIKIQNRRPLRKDTMEDIFRGVLYCGECGHKLSRMVTERKVSYKEVKTFVFYSCPNSKRIDEEKCENEQITFFQIQKVILHLLKKEFLLSSTQMKKLMEFNKEAGEKRKEQIQKAQDELQKSVDGADRKISSYYLEYRNRSISQVQFLETKKKLEEKKEQDRQTLRDLHTEYSSIDRMVDEQNQFLRTILKYKSCAELNAELVKNLIEKIYVYRGKRVEIIWKWNDEFAKVMGGTDDEK